MTGTKKRKQRRPSAVEIAYSLRGEFAGIGELVNLATTGETHIDDLSEEEVVSLVLSLVCDPPAVAHYLNLAEHAIFLAGATLSGNLQGDGHKELKGALGRATRTKDPAP